jgi:hypothetical protein
MQNPARANITQLKGNRLQIYTRRELINGWWTARTRNHTARGYYTKSLKTTDKQTAISAAESWYEELQLKINMGMVPVSKTATQICDLYLKQLGEEVARGDRKQSNFDDYKTVVEKFIRPYFSTKKVDTIRTKDVDNFVIWRQNYYVTGPGSKQRFITYVRNGKTIQRPAIKPKSATVSRCRAVR